MFNPRRPLGYPVWTPAYNVMEGTIPMHVYMFNAQEYQYVYSTHTINPPENYTIPPEVLQQPTLI